MQSRAYGFTSALTNVRTHERFQRVPVTQPLGLLSKQQLAARLGVSTRTVDRWTLEDGLPYVQIQSRRRYDLAAVLEWSEVASKEHL